MKILIIIPTYNEAENIEALIHKIFDISNELSVLVIDDNSPDKTYAVVKNLAKENSKIFALKREKNWDLLQHILQVLNGELKTDLMFIVRWMLIFRIIPNIC